MISKSAHSSFGDSIGWTSDVPLTWVTSTIGSLRIRVSAYSASNGSPSNVARLNMLPLLPFELWGMASASIPSSRRVSSQDQRSSGLFESIAVNGRSGASLPRKITLR